MRPRSVDGGIDEIPLPDVPGRLWLCGKHAIGPDVEALLEHTGATTVVCLNERAELESRFPDYVAWLAENDPASNERGRAIWYPILDLHAPPLDEVSALIDAVVARLQKGEAIVMHCGAGIGRAGTLAVGVLLSLGMPLAEALTHVRAHRPMAGPEVGAQLELVESLSERISPRS